MSQSFTNKSQRSPASRSQVTCHNSLLSRSLCLAENPRNRSSLNTYQDSETIPNHLQSLQTICIWSIICSCITPTRCTQGIHNEQVKWWCSVQTKEYCYSSVKSRPQFHGVPQEMITMEGEHQETCKISEALAYWIKLLDLFNWSSKLRNLWPACLKSTDAPNSLENS